MPSRRRRNRKRLLTCVGAASVGALLFFGAHSSSIGLGGGTWSQQQDQLFRSPGPPPPETLMSMPRQTSEADLSFARRLLPNRHHSPPQLREDAVLLPDREVLVLSADPAVGNAMCVFQGGASSPARALGRLPGPGRHAYLCPLPGSEQPLQPPPLLLSSSSYSSSAAPPATAPAPAPAADFRKLPNWNDSLVFDSAPLPGGDLLLFAKGTNHHRGVINTATSNIKCIYSRDSDGTVASSPATTSAQQVIRCPPPPAPFNSSNLHVTVALNGQEPLPSLATYNPQNTALPVTRERKSICACTMVRNVAKFLPEWVRYHAAVGVEKFFLYDNASEDDLAGQVSSLSSAGIDISTVAWPWTKTQEAGLSHCAASNQPSCEWMSFMDVDEFIFSPNWDKVEKPSKSLLESVVSVDPEVGQIFLPCYDFGPSGQTAHPLEGVCQGYTCRLTRAERHKSLVRLDAVADSLANSVHHFILKPGFEKVWTTLVRINHYKYQAWTEFKSKFKRRVSAYVADWTDPVNLQSHDRAPGLGVDPVEPVGWAESFCELKDYTMKKLTEKWFGIGSGGRGATTEFNSNGDIAPSPLFHSL
ncbi:glycosyltransferase family 92 protein Os08g0121900-like [Lolium rigidum]|uniref:glycosyltransferase family 92 protein Os08g0121900-like n=1 Tax=Lolium rigidum TaxID=89674 RepID=UPI001F5CA9A8|nr:glycosyltransferase family 92 protein Os08g0121900-like [Lolium rigidum]